MVTSIDGSNMMGLVTSLIKEDAAMQDVALAVLNKAQDIERVEGESALKLIDSAAVTAPGRIDVYA